MTPVGEIVFLRSALEFKEKIKRKSVIEENLLDIKRLLKNSV
jgi:hypothetical protein